MAMASSLAPLLLLSVLVATAAAARSVGNRVYDACNKSQFPKVCAEGLETNPESQKATPRQLAELFVGSAVEKGSSLGTFLQRKATSVTGQDKAMINCYDSCGDDIEEAMAHLKGLLREPTDAKFLELKSWLSSTLGGTSTCEDACKDIPRDNDVSSDKDDVVEVSVEFEKLLRVTVDLITQASGSMSADIALPPSDAAAPAAYGAAAPPLGGSSAEAPAAAGSEGPSSSEAAQGGGASGPSAYDSPAAAADAPSAGGSASAPAPSGSAAADAPSGSSGADAPSGGDSDAPAPDDGASGDDGSDDSDDKA